MQYMVYSDASASYDGNCSALAYIILRDGKYLTSGATVVYGVNASSRAESLSLGNALGHLYNEFKPTKNDKCHIFIDSMYVFKFVRKMLKSKRSGERAPSPTNATWLYSVHSYLEKLECDVQLKKVTAHTGLYTPHAYIDRLAKYTLRSVV